MSIADGVTLLRDNWAGGRYRRYAMMYICAYDVRAGTDMCNVACGTGRRAHGRRFAFKVHRW